MGLILFGLVEFVFEGSGFGEVLFELEFKGTHFLYVLVVECFEVGVALLELSGLLVTHFRHVIFCGKEFPSESVNFKPEPAVFFKHAVFFGFGSNDFVLVLSGGSFEAMDEISFGLELSLPVLELELKSGVVSFKFVEALLFLFGGLFKSRVAISVCMLGLLNFPPFLFE